MYVPKHFQAPGDESVRQLLSEYGAADLITVTGRGLLATMLPLIYLTPAEAGTARPFGSLIGHVARNNEQWRLPPIGEALVIVRGEDSYITPSWYPAKKDHGRVVPTWNYITAHVYGELVVHDDAAWVESMVRRLTGEHEGRRPAPWSVDDAPGPYIQGQLRAIVGLEVVISRIEAKFKLGQNRSVEDIAGMVNGLADSGRTRLAGHTERAGAGRPARAPAQPPT